MRRRDLAGVLWGGTAWGQQRVELFRRGQEGVHTYRIPALIETRGGDLLAVADARLDSDRDLPGRIRLVMRRSGDGGRSWGAITTLKEVREGGVGDASLLRERDGRIWCFFAYGPPGIGFPTAQAGELTGPTVLQSWAMHSDDAGRSWTQAVDLTPRIRDRRWQAMFPTSGTHFVTRRGRMVVPMVVRDENGVISSRNAYSDDRGKTWAIGPGIRPGSDESKAVELANGEMYQNMRYRNQRLVGWSRDGGVSFDRVREDEQLTDAVCNAGLARVGRWLVLTNAASRKRENLVIRASGDGGWSWGAPRVLHAGPAAYSTVIGLRGGDLGVLYECGEQGATERIEFQRLKLAEVAKG
ncbi:MAG: exo-alpha-sialidase [Acidobacteriota bacterium]